MSVMPVYGAFNDIAGIQSENDIKVLEGLGIVEPGEVYSPESYITRGDFFIMTAGLLGYKTTDVNEAAQFLSGSGIVSGYGNGEFKFDNAITYNEALKILVVALGYNNSAVAANGWPTGYMTVATSLNLIEPVDKIIGDGKVTRGMAATLLVRAGNTETAEITYRDGASTLGPIGGGTLFYEKLKVSKLEGIVNANSATSLAEPSGVALNAVKIGTNVIDAGNTNAKEYLGWYVEAYCVEEDGYEALAVVPSKQKNRVLRIASSGSITAAGNQIACEISYYTTDGKVKRVKLSDYDVIYNGCAYRGFTMADFSINSGEVVLLDNDADGTYEVAFINEYETYVVDAVNTETETVFDKYGKTIELKSDNEQLKITGSNGTYTTISAIKKDDVLSVMKSREGDVITVRIVNDKVNGQITGIQAADGRTRLTIGNEKYYVSKEFEANTHPEKITPYTGLEGVFSLDAEGAVAHIETATGTQWNYGYIISANKGDEDGKIYFKLFTTSNKFERFEVVDRVIVDGAVKKVAALTAADDAWMARQIIGYQAEGNILKKIDTAESVSTAEDGTLNMVSDIDDATYNSNAKMFYRNHDTLLGGTDGTIVFQIPTTESYFSEEKYFSAGKMSIFSNETAYSNLDAYNVNDAGIAEIIVRRANDSLGVGSSKNFIVVESVSVVLDDEGTPVQKLTGLNHTGAAVTVLAETDTTVPDTVGVGDVLRYRQKGGVTISFEEDFDFDTDYPEIIANSLIANTGSYYASLNYACGYIDYVDGTHLVLANQAGTKKITYALGTAAVILADTDTEKVTKISLSGLSEYLREVSPGAKAAVIAQSGKVTTIVIKN